MRIVMGAQNCGFGPAAELVAVSRLLSGHERVFVGDGVAAAFARRNPDAFDEIRELTGTRERSGRLDELVGASDQVISVMDADLILRAVVAGRPTVMVDSLFSFWQLRRPLGDIRSLCESMPRSSSAAAGQHLAGLSPHERVIAAHFVATHSIVQNFPGVSQRMAEFAEHGARSEMHLSGSLIDLEGLRNVPLASDAECELLINIGGFKNFLLDFEINNDYLLLLRRWIPDLLRDWRRFRRVLVCGGPFDPHRTQTISVGDSRADCRLLPQRELLRRVAATPHYLIAPGLTALHESVALGHLPFALPEQHYAHIFTVRHLDGTLFGRTAARFADVVPLHPVPEDDFSGTAALVDIAGRVREDDKLYARFREMLNERIEEYLSLTPAQRKEGVAELKDVLHGESIPSVIARIVGPRTD